MRSYSWRRHNHPFTLSFLEEVLRCVGMNEVHKAVTLFLDTLAKQPGSACTQRWGRGLDMARRTVPGSGALSKRLLCSALTGVCTESSSSSRWQRWAKTTSVRSEDHMVRSGPSRPRIPPDRGPRT